MSEPIPTEEETPGAHGPVWGNPSQRMPTAECPVPSPDTPLQDGHFARIRQAVQARRKLRSAARTATVSAGTTLAIAVLALLAAALQRTPTAFLVAAALSAIGVVEWVGGRRLRRASPSATGMLAANQLAFLGLIVLYCVVQMATFSPAAWKAAAVSPEFRTQLSAMPDVQRDIDGQIDRWAPLAVYGFYGLVILLSAAAQGGLALYYFTRRKHVAAFTAATPEWIRRLFVEIGA